MNCAICNQPCVEGEFQDTGEPVHTRCRTTTFWQAGSRVVSRFWSPGDPAGTVREAKVIYGPVQANAFAEPEKRAVEWVTIEFDDGAVREYAAGDIVKAP